MLVAFVLVKLGIDLLGPRFSEVLTPSMIGRSRFNGFYILEPLRSNKRVGQVRRTVIK